MKTSDTIFVCFAVSVVLASAQASKPTLSLEKFTVQSDGHPMAVWARRPANPRGAVLFVHGMTWSTRPDFDLQVPGLQRSVFTSFATQGFAAYGVDLRGYGDTPRDSTGWLTPKRAAADVSNVLTWVASQHPSLPKPALVGWSRGAGIAGTRQGWAGRRNGPRRSSRRRSRRTRSNGRSRSCDCDAGERETT